MGLDSMPVLADIKKTLLKAGVLDFVLFGSPSEIRTPHASHLLNETSFGVIGQIGGSYLHSGNDQIKQAAELRVPDYSLWRK